MSWDPPNATPSPEADPPQLAELVRLRGAPLLEALESHLPGSRDHAEATGAHAFAAAVRLGLDRAASELCRETAKLHDVGMVYVPLTVMSAPFASWTAEQRAAFDGHYDAGAKLALGAGIPDDVCGWLLQIRERYDGAGPDRLAGEAIPIASRVTRAACAVDTMLASAESGDTLEARRASAITRLRAASGAELDPRVVEALIAAVTAA